jgi:hypothetical protein
MVDECGNINRPSMRELHGPMAGRTRTARSV